MPLEPKQEPPYYEITTGPGPAGTKYYIANLLQFSTNAPEPTVLNNDHTTPVTYAYLTPGVYTASHADFLMTKTTCQVSGIFGGTMSAECTANGIVTINTQTAGSSSDDLLNNNGIQIITFP